MNSDIEVLEGIRDLCGGLPGAEESLLQDRPLFHVRRRRFAIFNADSVPFRKRWQGFARSIHFATHPEVRQTCEADDRFLVSPHHGFRGWMALDLKRGAVDWTEVRTLIVQAYRHVANKQFIEEFDGRL